MTATTDGNNVTAPQAWPPIGDVTVLWLLRCCLVLAIVAFGALWCSYGTPGSWLPQDPVRSTLLVAAPGFAFAGLVFALFCARQFSISCFTCGGVFLSLAYAALRLTPKVARAVHYRMEVHTPWMNVWSTSLRASIISTVCLWVCMSFLIAAAVITLRGHRTTSKPPLSAAQTAPKATGPPG
jgi:hypothetical protein